MLTYATFAPTGLDVPGAFLDGHGDNPDRHDWFVMPCSRTRDSGPFSESNFEAALDRLGGESEEVEVHRFGHWGPGWFEIIIVKPATEAHAKAVDIVHQLEQYPLLDEDDFSERQYTEACSYFYGMNLPEKVDLCRSQGESIFAARSECPSDFYERAPRSWQHIEHEIVSE